MVGHSPTFHILLQQASADCHCMLAGESMISSNMTISAFHRTQKLRFNVPQTHRRQSWGVGGRDPQILGRGVVGVAGGSQGRGRVIKYYYILSCTGSMFESGDF